MRAQEFLPEKINDAVLEPDFRLQRRMKNGLVIQARGQKRYSDMPDSRGVKIEIFDPATDPELRWPVADVSFAAKQDRNTGEWYLSSLNTGTKEAYRRRGLASAMYNFARMLDNEVRPSRLQTHAGADFWQQGGAGAGKPLELSDEPVFRSEPPPPPPEPTKPQPQGFLQRWRRILAPGHDIKKAQTT